MTGLEKTMREKSDKRASEDEKIARIVREEIYQRRRRFFKQASEDPRIRELLEIREELLI